MKHYIKLMAFAFTVGVIMNIGHPVTPKYILELNLQEEIFGYCFAIMSVGVLVMAPIWGNIGDMGKRKLAVVLGIVGYGIGQVLFSIATTEAFLLLARFVSGFFASSIVVSGLSFASTSECFKEFKAKTISGFVSFNVFGASFGYLIGGELGVLFSPKAVFDIQAILCMIVAILIVFIYDFKTETLIDKKPHFISNFTKIRHLEKPMLLLILVVFLVSFAHTDIARYVDVYVSKNGYNTAELGAIVFITGLITIVVNKMVAQPLLKRKKPILYLAISIALSAVLIIITFRQENLIFGMYTFYMVYIASKALYEPLIVNHLSDTKNQNMGVLLGVRQSAVALGQIIGPIVGAYIFKSNMLTLFDVSAIILLVSVGILAIYSTVRKEVKE